MNGTPVNNKPSNGKPANGKPLDGAVHDSAIGIVRPADITQEMQVAYLDYAMSVIVARALPDVRDGLKPVHRRILFAMWHDLSLTHDKPHKKSARIVGEVLGKYHPHGDSAVYDAMVRMAQDFSLRYPLVDGQGNFGSIDGDNAAAMRYTEARLARITDLMLTDLEKDTVGWHPNFDNTLREPDILPAALPNLLINGSAGIAVGMATNIPPHNLGEVVDALVFLIDRFDKVDEITTEQLMQYIKGPDFPTGGIVYRFREEGKGEDDADAIAQGYSLGKSRLVVQAKAHFEEISRGRTRIIITELPYQTNKTALLERIADLVRDGKLEGISDLRDESDRTGMRIVVELARTVEPKEVLADLYKYTPLQQTFGMQMLALVDGQPRLLSLKRMLQLFVQHRQEIIRRRSEFELKQARERAHIVEGLLRALDILDEVIHTIRHSQTVDTARKNLVANFQFTEIQAQAILDMQLRRLAALERKKLQEEFAELKKRIAYLEDLLAHPHKILDVIRDELVAIRQEYADARRTQIVDRTRGALTTHDLLPDQMVWVSVSRNGDVRRQPAVDKPSVAVLRQIGRDSQIAMLTANTRDVLYVFTRDGRCGRVDVHQIPADETTKSLADFTGFKGRDGVATVVALPRARAGENGGCFFFASERGVVKRVSVEEVQANTASEFSILNVEDGDRLGWALHTQGGQEVLLLSVEGQSIRFAVDEVRVMGLPAGGVGGMKLRGKDRLVYAGVVDPDGEMATISVQGFAKRSTLAEYSSQGRNGGGILAHKLVERTGKLGAGVMLPAHADADNIVLVSAKGVAKPFTVADIPRMGRAASGKQILTLAEKDTVAAAWRVVTGRNGPGDDGVSEETKTPAEAPAPPAPRRQAARQTVPPEQAELLEEAVAATSKETAAPVKGLATAPAAATPLPLKRVKGSTAIAETVPAGKTADKSAEKPAGKSVEKTVVKPAAKPTAMETPPVKPATRPAAKGVEKSVEKPAAGTAGKPTEGAGQKPSGQSAVATAKPQAKPKPKPGAESGTESGNKVAEARTSKQPDTKQAAGKQPEAAKPVDTITKSKPGSRPTPAEIAGGARAGRCKQEASTPRFAFADAVDPKPEGTTKLPAGAPAKPETGKPAAKKLDTVVSVTKSQAGHSKTEKDAPTEKPKK
jgi:DNA gyrase subunit A